MANYSGEASGAENQEPGRTCPARWLLERPIAHRGLFDNLRSPENSLLAFRNAVEAGLPIELDVRLSADGRPLVFHDRRLERLAGLAGNVECLTAGEAGRIRLLETSERIPLLDEVLEVVAGRVPLLVEVKCLPWQVGPLEDAVIIALRAYRGELAVQSFNPFALRYIKLRAPFLCRGQLSGGRAGLPFLFWTQPHFVAYDVRYLPRRSVTRARRRGIPLLAWTIATRRQHERAYALADNFIFDAAPELRPYLPGASDIKRLLSPG